MIGRHRIPTIFETRSQALQVLEKAKRDEDLHNIPCNLQKIPGKIYYLYKKVESGDRYFSMISPEEWGDMGKDKCLGEYRLEADRSWTSEDEMSKMQLRQRQCNRMVLGNKAMIDFGE
uniref:Uncharacterized protein n=1 Tax=Ditylenchus dipsaci TaxID=166011 RepID=A0A915ELC5_9BILA